MRFVKGNKISISKAQDGFERSYEKRNASIRDPEKNPFLQRNVAHPTSDLDTLIHLSKGSFGTGVFAMPFAFANSGYAVGIFGALIIGFVCSHCVHILVKSGQELCWRHNIPTLNFGGIAEVTFREGPRQTRKLAGFMKGLIHSFVLVIALGACCIFKVFVASNLSQVINYHTGVDIDIRLYILMVAGLAIILAMIRNLRIMAPFSLLSNVFVLASVVIVFIYIFDDLPSITEREAVMPISRLPIFFSIIVYSLEGINVVMPLENNMKNPQNFLGCFLVLNTAMTVIVCLFTMVGFFGYLKYGDEVEGSISLNLPEDEILAQASKIMLSIAIILTHPLQFYCAIELTWPTLGPKIYNKFPNFSKILAEYIYRIILILITVVVAVSIPNLGALISIGGAVCLSTLGLMFPSMIETIVFWDNLGKWNWILWKNILIFLFGMLVFVTGLIGSIIDVILSFQENPDEEGLINDLRRVAEQYYFI